MGEKTRVWRGYNAKRKRCDQYFLTTENNEGLGSRLYLKTVYSDNLAFMFRWQSPLRNIIRILLLRRIYLKRFNMSLPSVQEHAGGSALDEYAEKRKCEENH